MNFNSAGKPTFPEKPKSPSRPQQAAFKDWSATTTPTVDPNQFDSEYNPNDSQRSHIRANYSEAVVKGAHHWQLVGFQKLPFQQVVKHVAKEVQLADKLSLGRPAPPIDEFTSNFKFTRDAVSILHLNAEVFAIELFEGANLCTHHRGRMTLMDKDLRLARRLRSHTTEHYT